MDSYYRGLVDNPQHYDRMVVLLREYNPSTCSSDDMATLMIHECISRAMRDGDAAIGCCFAMRTQKGDKVRLFLEPLIPQEERRQRSLGGLLRGATECAHRRPVPPRRHC